MVAAFAVALALSHSAWPASPCHGHEKLSYGQPPIGFDGMATPGACSAIIRPSLGMARTCEVALHELGHLAGLGHSANPDSVMTPDVGRVPDCDTWAALPAPRARWVVRCHWIGHAASACMASTRESERRFVYRRDGLSVVEEDL